MKISTGKMSLHNKFEVEVRDAKTGELKQKATAYNLVCESVLTKLAGYDGSYNYVSQLPKYISYGRGTTLPTGKTGLSSRIGYDTASVVEYYGSDEEGVIYTKRKITLNAATAVGESITEIGFNYGPGVNDAVSHALIKDSEGNQISITKTDTDIITIYGTLYMTLDRAHNGAWIKYAGILRNSMVSADMAEDRSVRYGEVGLSEINGAKHELSRTAFVCRQSSRNPVASGSGFVRTEGPTRFDADQANGKYYRSIVGKHFHIDLKKYPGWSGMIAKVDIGVGDGVTTEFDSPVAIVEPDNVNNKVLVDGIEVAAIISKYSKYASFLNLIDGEQSKEGLSIEALLGKGTLPIREYQSEENSAYIELYLEKEMSVSRLTYELFNGNVRFYYSQDGTTWTQFHSDGSPSWDWGIREATLETPTPPAKYFKVVFWEYYDNRSACGVGKLRFVENDVQKQIILDSPPAVGQIITAELFCNGLYKSDKHALDFSISYQFGDGGAV